MSRLPETREWSEDEEIHTILWDSLLPPPPDTPHAKWCSGCRINALKAELDALRRENERLRYELRRLDSYFAPGHVVREQIRAALSADREADKA